MSWGLAWRLPRILLAIRGLLTCWRGGMFWRLGRLSLVGAGSGSGNCGREGEVDMRGRRGRVARADAPRVIVVGAGFAGLAAVGELARAGMQVMLVDHNGYSTFQPLLYQVATAGLNPGDVVYSARAFTRRHGARFRLGELTGIDARRRRITLADGGEFEYDYLIMATGVSAAYYGVPGAAENSLGLYTRRDAVGLRDHIMARLERLDIRGPGQGREIHDRRRRSHRRGTGRGAGGTA